MSACFLQLLNQDYRQVTLADIPLTLEFPDDLALFLLFGEDAVRLQVDAEGQTYKFVIFCQQKYTARGAIAFLALLQSGFLSFWQILRFLYLCQVYDLLQLVGQFLLRFDVFYTTEYLTYLCDLLYRSGRECLQCLTAREDSPVHSVVVLKQFDHLTYTIFSKYVKFHVFYEKYDCMYLVSFVCYHEQDYTYGDALLLFVMLNALEIDQENYALMRIIDTQIMSSSIFRYSKLLIYFMKINVRKLSQHFTDIVFYHVFKAKDAYATFNKFINMDFPDETKEKYIHRFILAISFPCQDAQQKGILFRATFQHANSHILNYQFYLDEMRSWVEFKRDVVESQRFTYQQIEQLAGITDLYFILCLARLKKGRLISRLNVILRSMYEQFTFFVDDTAVLAYFRYNLSNIDSGKQIIEFPSVDKQTMEVVLALVFPDVYVTGYQLTVCYAAASLMYAIYTGNCSGKVFDVSYSQLYLCQIMFAVALLTKDYKYIKKIAHALIFTDYTLSLIANFEKQFVVVLFQMEKLLNFICSFLYGHNNFRFAFSYAYFETKLNDSNIEIIYACYMSCYRVLFFYYLLLFILDYSVHKRYFNYVFQHTLMACLISEDYECLRLLLAGDTQHFSLIASNVLDMEIGISPEILPFYRLFRVEEFTMPQCMEITKLVHRSIATHSESLNVQFYAVYRMVHYFYEKKAFALYQILFHASNCYIDNFVNRQYIIDLIIMCQSVKMQFEHINGFAAQVYRFVHVVIAAAQSRNCFISAQDLQVTQSDSALVYSDFIYYISDFLLSSKQYPTYNLVSLSLISSYIFKMDAAERNRTISQPSQQLLRKYINSKVAYSERTKPESSFRNYNYVVLEKILQNNAKSTFCQPIFAIFQLIQWHFAVDIYLAHVATVYLLSKLYADNYYRKSISDLLYAEMLETVAYSSEDCDRRAYELFLLVYNAGIDVFDVFFNNSTVEEKQKVRFSTEIEAYRFTDYSVIIKLIYFLRKAKRITNAYFYVIYALQHYKIQEWIVRTNNSNQQRAIAQLLAYNERNNDMRRYLIKVDHKCDFHDYLRDVRQNLKYYYFGHDSDVTDVEDDPCFSHLVKSVKFNNVSFKYLETPLTRELVTSSLISQRIQYSQNMTPELQYYSLLCKQLDTNSEFSTYLTVVYLNCIHSNIRAVIEAQNTRQTILNKIIQLYFKAKSSLKSEILAIYLIVYIHNIILNVFYKSPELVEAYYKIFFVIWLYGCYIFKEQECKSVDHKLLHLYLTHYQIPVDYKSAFAELINENHALIESIILKIQPYYLLNYFVYLFDGYYYLMTTSNQKQVIFLLRIILISIQHYAHFDLILRKMATYYEEGTLCCDLRPVVRDYLGILFLQIEKSYDYSAIFRKYKAYSTDYTRTILQMKACVSARKTEQIKNSFYYPSFSFLKASLGASTAAQYEAAIGKYYVFNYRFEKQYQSKAKPQLYVLHTVMGERRLIIKGEDQTLIDNCIMDYLDNLNELLSFTQYRFRTYYIGQIYKRRNEKGYNIIEVLDSVIPLSDYVAQYPRSAFAKETLQNYAMKRAYYEEVQEQQLLKFALCAKNSTMQTLDQHFMTVDSIACWHVIQYVLAIADRHCDNILVDTRDSTLHNIDFEACFFYGKELPFPDVIDLRFSPIIIHLLGPAGTQTRYKQIAHDTLSLINQTQYLYLNCFMSVGGILQKQPIVMRLYERLSYGFERYWQAVQKSTDVVNQALMFDGWKPFDQTYK